MCDSRGRIDTSLSRLRAAAAEGRPAPNVHSASPSRTRNRLLKCAARKRRDQTACKPGSVPSACEHANATIIPLDRPLPDGSRDLPGRLGRRRPAGLLDQRDAPIWSCSRRGLPCRPGYPVRGGLLPHPFTLTISANGCERRFAFCGAIPRVTPGGRYPPPCRRGARTFLPPWRLSPLRRATARPSDPPTL
jgi:hypothetical protein